MSKRYGNLKNASSDVKQHRFFDEINWNLMFQKAIVPPYKPSVKNESDTENFHHYSSSDDYLVPPIKEKDDPFLSW